MNPQYLASYSAEDSMLVVRDFVKGKPILKVQNFNHLLGLNMHQRSQYAVGYEIGDMIMYKEDPHILITSESKRIRLWDLRQAMLKGAIECLVDPDPTDLRSKSYTLDPN